MEEVASSKLVMRALTLKNYHLWVRELEGLAEKHKVWRYVDSDDTDDESEEGEYPDISRYPVDVFEIPEGEGVSMQNGIRLAEYADELNDRQRASYQLDIQTFKMKREKAERVAAGLRAVDAAIKSSVRMYISDDKMTASVRDVVIALAKKFERSTAEIIRQLQDQYRLLKTSLIKDKIETWVADWKNL